MARSTSDRAPRQQPSIDVLGAMGAIAGLFRDSPMGVAEIGFDGGYRIDGVNPAFLAFGGWSVEEVMGGDPVPLLGQVLGRAALESMAVALDAGRSWRGVPADDMACHWGEWSLLPLGVDGSAGFLLVVEARDAALVEPFRGHSSALQEMRTIMLTVQEGIQLWDGMAEQVYANPASERLLGGDCTILAGKAATGDVRSYFNADGMRCLPDEAPVTRVLRSGEPVNGLLIRIETAGGASRWISVNAYPIRDETDGQVVGAVTSTSDVTQSVEAEARLKRMAHFDALTQLPNRVLLSDRLHLAIARSRRSSETVAVCLMDLDGFKAVNDTLGHKAGDQLLVEVSRRLQETIRADDTAARLGGDEFAILLEGLKTGTECEQTLNRIVTAIAAPYAIGGEAVRVSASIGVTLFPNDGADADKLLRHADQAMYKAKQAGKNCYSMFDPGQDQRLKANRMALRKIEEAIGTGQFQLYCQPQVDCRRGRVQGVEMLLRWNHPVLGLLSPAEFLPLVEQDDLIVRLGEWTFTEALAWQERWAARGIMVEIGVNLPARQLHQKEFGRRIAETLGGLGPERAGRINIEILESTAIEDINAVADLVSQGHALGLKFALDDFGTGYSSLVHLRRLGIDVLKIDQTFIGDMLDDPMDLAIVQGIVGLASAFRCDVVAEGVQNIDQILILLELGCETMQGYGLARPMPVERFPFWHAEFAADPRWQLASTPRPSRGDFQLLLAEATHRFRMDRLVAYVRGLSPTPPTPVDFATSRFGLWYYGEGLKRYGHMAGYRDIAGAYRVLDDAILRMLEASARSPEDGRRALDGEVAELDRRLLDLLKRLRYAHDVSPERISDAGIFV